MLQKYWGIEQGLKTLHFMVIIIVPALLFIDHRIVIVGKFKLPVYIFQFPAPNFHIKNRQFFLFLNMLYQPGNICYMSTWLWFLDRMQIKLCLFLCKYAFKFIGSFNACNYSIGWLWFGQLWVKNMHLHNSILCQGPTCQTILQHNCP